MPVPLEQRQVDQAPVPGARYESQVTPQALGSGVAQVGETLGLKIYQKSVQEANETAVADAENDLAQRSMQIQADMKNLKGKDAAGSLNFLAKNWDPAVAAAGKNLNPQQMQFFEARAAHRSLAMQQAAHDHMGQELPKYQDQVTQDTLKTSVDNARMNATNLAVVNTEKDSQTRATNEWADRHGVYGSPTYYQQIAQNQSTTNREVIGALLTQGQDQQAEAYYKQMQAKEQAAKDFETYLPPEQEAKFQAWKQEYAPKDSGADYDLRGAYLANLKPDASNGHWPDTYKKPNHPTFSDESKYAFFGRPGHWGGEDGGTFIRPEPGTTPEPAKPPAEFTATDRDVVEKQLGVGSTEGEARRQAQTIIATHGLETPEQQRAALAQAGTIGNVKVSDATTQRIEHQIKVFKDQQADQYTQTYQSAAKDIDSLAKRYPVMTPADLVGPTRWAAMKPAEQESLAKYTDFVRKPQDQVHDPKVWAAFQGVTDKELAELKPEVLNGRYLTHFDATHYDRALAQWNQARNLAAKGKADAFEGGLSNERLIHNAFKLSGLVDPSVSPSKWSAEQEIQSTLFETEASRAVSKLPKGATQEVVEKTIQDVVDRQLKQKFTVDPGWFSRNKEVPAISLGRETGRVFVPLAQVPQDTQDAIKGALMDDGIPPTKDMIEQLAALKLRKDLTPAQRAAMQKQIVGR